MRSLAGLARFAAAAAASGGGAVDLAAGVELAALELRRHFALRSPLRSSLSASPAGEGEGAAGETAVRTPVNDIEYFPPNFEGLVLGCIDADFCK